MKNIISSIRSKTLLAASIVCLSACTGDFDELNTNNNTPSTGTADLFLPHGIQSAVDIQSGGSLGMDIGEGFSQHWARIQYTDIDQYTVSSDVYTAGWQGLYIESLADYQRIFKISQETGNTNYQAVAVILRSWVFSMLTDIYGDIPYTDALQGLEGKLLPTYNAQKDVYAGLIAELKTAGESINVANTTMPVAGDILFNGDMLKWKKFANTLSLKILSRMIDKADSPINVKTEITRILSDPTKYPVLTSVSDNIQLNYLDATNNQNPVNVNRKTRDDHRVSATIINKMLQLNDARLPVYANKPLKRSVYTGVPNGLSSTAASKLGLDSTSKVGDYFVAPTAPGVIMTYAELLFLKAEFAYKGVTITGDAATNYAAAITASFAQYKLAAPTDYIAANALKAGADGFTQIMEQKWIALYGQGLEAWTEYRRTGIPALKTPTLNTNQNVLPTRLPYPGSEESLNYDNFSAALAKQGGKNDMKLKLWFAK
ncbi:hypothetical protein Dfri01_62970 [Dyadobacter frigoris]|uniref:SusD/RagB family nutrient-binding outer membrane lipoprotein n=1 Tax=Dyadobacter frigoris TaxID=2576211 RepID=UPI0024A07EC9|nr:SusD/RagB family nutrient-binding outer membrane lipoprotein [Dyadobacter frigoris]GLU56836.1 hypothetical protein Dfri01_62970 [Dyadobacter frigoris]